MNAYLSTGMLPDEYEQLRKTVADFARTVVAPVSAKHDAEHSFPYEGVAGMADMGLFGLPFPEEYGGMGGDYFALCLALEELGKVDQSVAITLEAGVSLGAMPVYRFGTEKQKQAWLAYNKVGWNASDTHPLSFTDVRVPQENLLGDEGRGYANFLHILDEGRIAIAALSVGVAQGCVDESIKYAREREAFGTPIGRNQAISFKIARMEARAHAARAAYYDAAALMLSGKNFKKEASIAKLVGSEAAMDNARDATQIHGGYGFMNEYTVARHYRDSKILEIGEGTTEVQLMLIARGLGL